MIKEVKGEIARSFETMFNEMLSSVSKTILDVLGKEAPLKEFKDTTSPIVTKFSAEFSRALNSLEIRCKAAAPPPKKNVCSILAANPNFRYEPGSESVGKTNPVAGLQCGREILTLAELQEAFDEAEQLGKETFQLRRALGYLQAQSTVCTNCWIDRTKKVVKYVFPCYCSLCVECCEKLRIPSGQPHACKRHNIPFPETFIATLTRPVAEGYEIDKFRTLMKNLLPHKPGEASQVVYDSFNWQCCVCVKSLSYSPALGLVSKKYSKSMCKDCINMYDTALSMVG